MTIHVLSIVKEVMKHSHLPIVKLDNEMFRDTVDGKSVITIRTQGISKKGNRCYTLFNDFSDTKDGKEKANLLFKELEAWNPKK